MKQTSKMGKKILLTLLSFLCIEIGYGAPVGNPASPAIFQRNYFTSRVPGVDVKTGYLNDYTSNKNLIPLLSDAGKEIESFGIFSHFGTFSVVLLGRWELCGRLGLSKESIDGAPSMDDSETKRSFSYSLGGKWVIAQTSGWYLGLDVNYFAIPKSKGMFSWIDQFTQKYQKTSDHLSLEEWQVALGLAAKIAFITPYVGVKYLRTRILFDPTDTSFKNKNPIGWYYGGSMNLGNKFSFNAEARVYDEVGFSLSADAVF